MPDLEWARYVELVDQYVDGGMADGLPVIPPHVDSVEAMLAATDREPGELIGIAPPRYQEVTVRDVAINAVLAGCLPCLPAGGHRGDRGHAGRRVQPARRLHLD